MKTASTTIQTFVLGALLAIHLAGTGGSQLTGVRRALQTMAAQCAPDAPRAISSMIETPCEV